MINITNQQLINELESPIEIFTLLLRCINNGSYLPKKLELKDRYRSPILSSLRFLFSIKKFAHRLINYESDNLHSERVFYLQQEDLVRLIRLFDSHGKLLSKLFVQTWMFSDFVNRQDFDRQNLKEIIADLIDQNKFLCSPEHQVSQSESFQQKCLSNLQSLNQLQSLIANFPNEENRLILFGLTSELIQLSDSTISSQQFVSYQSLEIWKRRRL